MQSPDVVVTMVRTALDTGRVLELLPLVGMLPPEPLAAIAAAVAQRDDAELDRLATQVHEADRWDALLPLAGAFDAPARRRLAALPLFTRSGAVAAVLDAAARTGRWDVALPLAAELPDQPRREAADALARLSDAQLRAAVAAAIEGDDGLLPALAGIAARAPAATRERIAELAGAAGHPGLAAQLTGRPAQ